MPFKLPGATLLTIESFVATPNRTMKFTSYWETGAAVATYAALLAMANDAHTNIGAVYVPLASDQVFYAATHLVYHDDTLNVDAWNGGAPLQGTAATVLLEEAGSQVLPDEVALIVQRRTAQLGRQHRGRMFIPGIWEGFNADGALNAGGAAAAKTFADYFGADRIINGVTCHARHWDRKDNAADVVVQCRARIAFGAQREREVRGPYIFAS